MAEVTRGGFAKRIVNGFDLEVIRPRIVALVAWQSAEGTRARYNPLATTQRMPGSSAMKGNTAGVQDYPDLKTGVAATIKTLKQPGHGYEHIIDRLANGTAREILQAVAASSWGTGALALEILPDVKEDLDSYANKPIGQ